MTQPIDDHALNACLAGVVGVEIKPHQEDDRNGIREGWVYLKERDERHEIWPWWDPLHDANQMEEVEAWLWKEGIESVRSTAIFVNLHVVELIHKNGESVGKDPDKKRAFAMAVWAMEQSNNNNKGD